MSVTVFCHLILYLFSLDDGTHYEALENEARHRTSPNVYQTEKSYDRLKVEIEPIKLQKSVGLISGTSLIVGTIIGKYEE